MFSGIRGSHGPRIIKKKFLMKKFLSFALCLFALAAHSQTTENVVLITLDGMRWQEVFSGAEKRLIAKKFAKDSAGAYKKFWTDDPIKRRELLFPFLWSTLQQNGQLYGNRNVGNKVNVTNNQWFSYPGYNEILTGSCDNTRITSNDQFDNPNKNVLEFINSRAGFEGKAVAFTSWENFPWILNVRRSGLMVNAGWMPAKDPNCSEQLLNELSGQLPNITGGTRLDALTFHYAFEYLKKNRPRVLYISFDETDHFAHEGEYDHYLASANNTDGYLRTLWTWLQSDAQYKNKTTLIITTDHGRGNRTDEWRHHGKKIPECDQIWFAFLGPDSPALGEVKTEQQLYQNQVAKTLAALLGIDYVNEAKPGESIRSALKGR